MHNCGGMFLADVGMALLAGMASLSVSRGTEVAPLPFLTLAGGCWGSGWSVLHSLHQTGRGWCVGKALVPLDDWSHQSFPKLCQEESPRVVLPLIPGRIYCSTHHICIEGIDVYHVVEHCHRDVILLQV